MNKIMLLFLVLAFLSGYVSGQPPDKTGANGNRTEPVQASIDIAGRAVAHGFAAREAIANLHPKTARREIDALRALPLRWDSQIHDLEREYQRIFAPAGYSIRHPEDYMSFLHAIGTAEKDRDYDVILRLLDGRDTASPPGKDLRDELRASFQSCELYRPGFITVAQGKDKEKKLIRNFARFPGTRECLESPDSRFTVWWEEPPGPSNVLVLAECGSTNVSRIAAFQRWAKVMWSPDSTRLAVEICPPEKQSSHETLVWIVNPLVPERIVKCEEIAPDELKFNANECPPHFSFFKWNSNDSLSVDCFVVTTNAVLPVSPSSWSVVRTNGFWKLIPDLLDD